MASTYSNLKLQLMTTGENLATWGNVTNVNLGTALEEAIVGSADVTFSSGTVTLTLSNTNATQTARNMRLNLTGTSGGAQNLVVPAIEKIYVVHNGCADAITVKNATGTGIAVPAGKTMWVYNDGTNVVDVVTHLTSLTLGTALPVTSGGTGVTTSTGSGNNVLSASPTLTGTAIGSKMVLGAASAWVGTVTIEAFNSGASGFALSGYNTAGAGSGSLILRADNVASSLAVFYYGAGAIVGSITTDGSTTTYGTTSDARLKNVLGPQRDFGGIIDSVWVGDFEFKASPGHARLGVIAQQLKEHFSDPVRVPENPEEMQTVDYGQLSPLALWGVKELRARVATLEARLAALEAK